MNMCMISTYIHINKIYVTSYALTTCVEKHGRPAADQGLNRRLLTVFSRALWLSHRISFEADPRGLSLMGWRRFVWFLICSKAARQVDYWLVVANMPDSTGLIRLEILQPEACQLLCGELHS